MPMTSAKFVPYETKTSVIKIASYQDKNPTGVLINPYFEEEQHFNSLTQLILLVEHLQDELIFPQKAMDRRTFNQETASKATGFLASSSGTVKEQTKATFKLSILFRQNASWQGSILWMEQSLQSEFRSLLELITLMDSVLSEEISKTKGECI